MRIRSPFRAFKNAVIRKGFLEAQLIVTRRCNLSCGYCTEYDNVSKSVPYESLRERIDALHRLGVVQIALLGGEPLMHEDVDRIVTRASRASQVSMTTNGFLVGREIIKRLNGSGLSHMQVSIDALTPKGDMYIQKTMKTLQGKLELLLQLADFSVHANIVLCEESRPEFKQIVAELRRLEIPVTVNLLHDARGMVTVKGPSYVDLWDHHYRESKVISHIEYEYGKSLLQGERKDWLCRAGSRHIYVDEFGMTQFCASQRGRLNKPVVEYTREDMRQHAGASKGCEKGCAVFCVFRASQFDNDFMGVARALLKSVRNSTISIPIRAGNKRPQRAQPPLETAGDTKRT
ncbi:MAG: radical SAM protein [Candidatus Krumholzibacteriia bacterium]